MSIRVKRLSDICSVRSGGTPRRGVKGFYGGDIPWAKISDIDRADEKDTLWQTEETISDQGLANIGGRLFPPGTLLFSMYGSIGKMAYAGRPLACNQAILGIDALNPDILHLKYLFYYLTSIREKLIASANGVALKNLSATIVKSLQIPLPPLAEQRRIAAILDKADELVQNDKKALAKYDQLAQSIFLEIFGDPVTNPMGWEVKKLGEMVDEVKYGTSSKAEEAGSLPYLRMNNLTYDGRMDLEKLKFINLSESEFEKYTVRKGDLLFNRTNSKELVGKSAIFSDESPMAFAGYLIRVRPNSTSTVEYVWGFLNSRFGKLKLSNMCKNIVGMANINATELKNIKLLSPPKYLQDQFRDIYWFLNIRRSVFVASLQKSQALFDSLLQRAFRGDL